MNDDQERLSYAQWVLDRNLHWIGAAEVKTGVIVALNTAMLGGLAAAFSSDPQRSVAANLLAYSSAALLLIALFCAAMSVLPRTEGPATSFVFFGKIAKSSRSDYVDSFMRADKAAFLDDCLAQIHRNAEVACDKFRWVRNAMLWSFVAVLPWMGAIGCLMKV
jgi:hypothetical protein